MHDDGGDSGDEAICGFQGRPVLRLFNYVLLVTGHVIIPVKINLALK